MRARAANDARRGPDLLRTPFKYFSIPNMRGTVSSAELKVGI